MKIGDRVFVVSDQLVIANGSAGEVAVLNQSTTEVGVRFGRGPAILKIEIRDLLPANIYAQSVLNAVFQTVEDIERETGSILNLKPEAITAKLIEHGLTPQAARQCAELFDTTDWNSNRLPLRSWLTRIRDFYYPGNCRAPGSEVGGSVSASASVSWQAPNGRKQSAKGARYDSLGRSPR